MEGDSKPSWLQHLTSYESDEEEHNDTADVREKAGNVKIEEDKEKKVEGNRFGLLGYDDVKKQEEGVDSGPSDASNTDLDLLKNANFCCICKSTDIKYRCPRCQLRTCNLPCVNKHKEIFSCDGKRDRTPYVRIGDFTEKHFIDDFFFLQEAEEAIERSERTRKATNTLFGRSKERIIKTIREQKREKGEDTKNVCLPSSSKKKPRFNRNNQRKGNIVNRITNHDPSSQTPCQ